MTRRPRRGRHHARSRWRSPYGLVVGAIVMGLMLTLHPGHGSAVGPHRLSASAQPAPGPAPSPMALVQPSIPTRPRYLSSNYRAPAGLVEPGAAGSLRIPSLGIAAPIDTVGLDVTTMAIPNDPQRLGWLKQSATAEDRAGSSVLSGHVSDEHDVPGALNRLHAIRVGAVIIWTSNGVARRFVVTGFTRYPRARGVPAAVFRTDGPHVLRVVTCTDRVSTAGGGFHYASNLVVTARA